MTSGTKIEDRRYTMGLVGTNCLGTTTHVQQDGFGYYSIKSWVGADTVTLPAPKRERVVAYAYGVPGNSDWIRTTKYVRSAPKRRRYTQENPYTMTASRVNNVVVTNICTCTGYPRPSEQNQGSSAGFNSNYHRPWSGNDDLQAIDKLRGKIQGSDFNMAVTLGESAEALATIRESALRLRRAAQVLRSGSPAKAARALLVNPKKSLSKGVSRSEVTKEWFADNWLQLQYGWLPLLADAASAAKHLAYLMNRPVYKVYKCSHYTRGTPVPASPAWLAIGESYRSVHIKAIISHISEVKLAGLMDPASLLWEKLPYSFVADWFIPVGSYLSARGLDSSLTGRYVVTRFDKLRVDGYSSSGIGHCYFNMAGSGYLKEDIYVDRSISTALPVPQPSFKPLSEVDSWKRATSAVALLIQAFSRF